MHLGCSGAQCEADRRTIRARESVRRHRSLARSIKEGSPYLWDFPCSRKDPAMVAPARRADRGRILPGVDRRWTRMRFYSGVLKAARSWARHEGWMAEASEGDGSTCPSRRRIFRCRQPCPASSSPCGDGLAACNRWPRASWYVGRRVPDRRYRHGGKGFRSVERFRGYVPGRMWPCSY